MLNFFKKFFLVIFYIVGPLLLINFIFSILFAETLISDEAKHEIQKHKYSFVLHGGYSKQISSEINYIQREYVLVKFNPLSSITITGIKRKNQASEFRTKNGGLIQQIIFLFIGIVLTLCVWLRFKIRNNNLNHVDEVNHVDV